MAHVNFSNLKLSMDAQTHSAVQDMLKSTITHPSAPPAGSTKQSTQFLRGNSPPLQFPNLLSPPLFPRDQRPGHFVRGRTSTTAGEVKTQPFLVDSVNDLVPLLSPVSVVEEKEEDLFREHLKIVDGWREITD